MEDRHRDRLWRLVTERAPGHGSSWVAVVCAVAIEQVNVDGAAISVRGGSRAQELAAASSDWAASLEELQYTVGEGPGVEAFATGGPVLVSDLQAEKQRWPGLTDTPLPAGAAAVFAFPLQTGGIRVGTLDLYRHGVGDLTAYELGNAVVLAELATTALLSDTAGDEADRAPWARESTSGFYEDVHVATGMLATELRISLEDALMRLRAHAFSRHLPLTDVARAVVARELKFDSSQE